jgi:hypothetical protein
MTLIQVIKSLLFGACMKKEFCWVNKQNTFFLPNIISSSTVCSTLTVDRFITPISSCSDVEDLKRCR